MTVRVMSVTKTVAGSVHPYDYGYEYSLREREDYTFEYSEAWGWRIVICTPNTGCPVLGYISHIDTFFTAWIPLPWSRT